MSDIHYFQRYSQRENVVTNNTLRLFAQIYNDSPSRLKHLLEALLDGVSIDIGVEMQQQTTGPHSVPDGALEQSSFKVVIETKRSQDFSVDQLRRHAEAFDGEEQRILLLLAPQTGNGAAQEATSAVHGVDADITFAVVTFKDVIDVLVGEGSLISPYERDLYELVEDYQNFCSAEGLIPDDDVLRAVPCGTSHEENAEYDLYYAPSSRGYRTHQYVGIYYDKSIRYIGRLDRSVVVHRIDGDLVVQEEDAKALTADEKHRIQSAMDAATEHGYEIETGHEFFLVDEFHETDFEKASKYGMMGAQYFNLRNYLDLDESASLPKTGQVAERLKAESWT
jgi:hypothetical protein